MADSEPKDSEPKDSEPRDSEPRDDSSRVRTDHIQAQGDREGSFLLSTVQSVANWCRKNSVWPLPLGLSCCGIEFMATAASRYDMARFGMEVNRFSPRQADLLMVAGTLTYKMAHVMSRLYDQMAEPKWVIAMVVIHADTPGVSLTPVE